MDGQEKYDYGQFSEVLERYLIDSRKEKKVRKYIGCAGIFIVVAIPLCLAGSRLIVAKETKLATTLTPAPTAQAQIVSKTVAETIKEQNIKEVLQRIKNKKAEKRKKQQEEETVWEDEETETEKKR